MRKEKKRSEDRVWNAECVMWNSECGNREVTHDRDMMTESMAHSL
jgi:hypothetical protein